MKLVIATICALPAASAAGLWPLPVVHVTVPLPTQVSGSYQTAVANAPKAQTTNLFEYIPGTKSQSNYGVGNGGRGNIGAFNGLGNGGSLP